MSLEKVKAYFAAFGMTDRIRELTGSSATVALAAAALGCEECRIAKTLSFIMGDSAILLVAAGDTKIDNVKFREAFGTRPHMLPAERVEPLIGHDVGGVCPFAVREGIDTYLDESLRRFDAVYPGAGSDNSMIFLTIRELEEHSRAKGWVDVCKRKDG